MNDLASDLVSNAMKNKRISVAPMIDYTTRDYRYFARLFNRHIFLYTEMISTGAILFGKQNSLHYDVCEHPLVLQLGGSDVEQMRKCAQIGQDQGFDEININVGCPSDRVQHNQIGACLMAEPQRVAKIFEAMQNAVSIPVTVKHRIGIDHFDSYEFMADFVANLAEAGCRHFIVHARIAWLHGLSPKQNREIPPLRYEDVYRLKRDFPDLLIEINGGISQMDAIKTHLEHLDGVMIGRAFYHDPYLLAQCNALWGEAAPKRSQILQDLYPYLQQRLAEGAALPTLMRHYLGLFQGLQGARKWRQALSGKPDLTLDDVKRAADAVFAQNGDV